jgi:hypothetical protein
MAEKIYKIRSWNPETGSFDAERDVTLAEYLAETKVASARAKAIHAANVATIKRAY